MSESNKQCKHCGHIKGPAAFYRKSVTRLDPVCIDCRKLERREKYRQQSQNTKTKSPTEASEKPGNGSCYKEYKYPDGRILWLTKEQFEAVCEMIKSVENADRRAKGLPLLRG